LLISTSKVRQFCLPLHRTPELQIDTGPKTRAVRQATTTPDAALRRTRYIAFMARHKIYLVHRDGWYRPDRDLTWLAPGAVWAVALPLLACGLGMGCCSGSVFAVALGDVRPEQAGSASGTLNAVHQTANAVGSAFIATAYLANSQSP
jgi:hypothetical protein